MIQLMFKKFSSKSNYLSERKMRLRKGKNVWMMTMMANMTWPTYLSKKDGGTKQISTTITGGLSVGQSQAKILLEVV